MVIWDVNKRLESNFRKRISFNLMSRMEYFSSKEIWEAPTQLILERKLLHLAVLVNTGLFITYPTNISFWYENVIGGGILFLKVS